ncbi:tyrosine-type recombinase/integrase [Rivibacter subsaxonicus]|uniref:Integrase n=1 Tax=Rivibacter subsaxonicus TaxID=457575 RepID=A0A4V2FSS7_9BURK|nr:integrase arm-type DNA-binding domain-containing protein [Rivibacter subsaxonicus]RZT95305.1 integrase [Rivibacter subsaxonicus]
MALTEAAVRKTVCPPDKKFVRVFDGGPCPGLYLEVSSASRRWFLKYSRPADKQQTRLALGIHPVVTLAAARENGLQARRLLAEGVDPVQQRREAQRASEAAAHTLRLAIERSVELDKPKWSADYLSRYVAAAERDIYPRLGDTPVGDLTAPMLLQMVRSIEARGVRDTASFCVRIIKRALQVALAEGQVERNCANDLEGVMAPKPPTKHAEALLDVEPLRQCYASLTGAAVVVAACKVLMLTAQRPGNIRLMKWDQLDLDKGLWTIPSSEMKRSVEHKANGDPHVVPLGRQAVEILRGLKASHNPVSPLVFQGRNDPRKGLSDATLGACFDRTGFGQSAHGVRASFRTVMAEAGVRPDVLEAQLAHAPRTALGRAYDRTQFLAQRAEAVQQYGDLIAP